MTAKQHITQVPHPAASAFRYLRRHEIDTGRWDDCIVNATNPLIYGRVFYLDAMAAGQWDALVLDDYRAVMPLTWRARYGVRYLYQPAFTQQTGIFSLAAIDPGLVGAFLAEVDRHFRFAEICLNYANLHPGLLRRTNFILPLDNPHDRLSAGYKKDLVRNLKAGHHKPLSYKVEFDLTTALTSFRREYSSRLPAIKENDYRNFERLCHHLRQSGQLLTRAVLDDRGEPLCSAVFLRDAHRFYLIHSTTFSAGRNTESNHFLLDRFIREFAGSPMVLDFEGSDHPGIAHFYANFGGINQSYYFYRRNRLPWPIRWLK